MSPKILRNKSRRRSLDDGSSPHKPTDGRRSVVSPRTAKSFRETRPRLTIRDLGWTREHAREVRALLAPFAADWDDPRMDIYDEA